MRVPLLRGSLLIAWIAILGTHLREEVVPEWFGGTARGYSQILSRDTLIIDSWARILFNETPIGYSHTSLETDENSSEERYSLNNKLLLKLNIMGETHSIAADTSALLDLTFELQKFSFALSSKLYNMNMTGRRSGKTTFDVVFSTDAASFSQKIEIPNDAIIYSPMTEMAIHRLKPGQKLSMKIFDPVTLSTSVMTVRALRKEEVVIGSQKYMCTVLTSEIQGTEILSWVSSDGRVVRQETPFGWILEMCSPEEAFEIARKAAVSRDLLAGMSVPCEGSISHPRTCRSLKLKLSGTRFTQEELSFPRQETISINDKDVILLVKRSIIPTAPAGHDASDSVSFEKYLSPTPFIQSDHPELIAMAESLTASCSNDIEKVLAVLSWVNSNIVKETAVSFPSALDVLHARRGDCNEHTYLFTALARASGIPAKVIVGLAYQNGTFYYHAWPSVYVGEWWELDPTWNQQAVDATHIALVEGELDQQVKIMKVLGNLRISLLKEDVP